MAHTHDHSHHHQHPDMSQGAVTRAFIIGIMLNSAFVIIEAAAGFFTHSLALLTDAGHNLSDVASMGLALFAARIGTRKSTNEYTYGFKKTSVLVSLFNSLLLLVAIGAIGWEAIQRIGKPAAVDGGVISWVAFAGILVNGITAWLFVKGKEKDLNIKGAYLHMAADALVSAGVVAAGITIAYTGWFWMDSIVSLVIIVVILLSTWGLFRDSLRLSMDAVPKDIDLSSIQERIAHVKGIKGVHHIHIWPLSTTETALTAHIVVNSKASLAEIGEIKEHIRHELIHASIQHVTLEVEPDNESCETEEC